jgi:alpha-D-ribose 1-methylphosphonate 5-triphosphate diphosphatase PhnM
LTGTKGEILMEELFAKLREYLQMEDEIPFGEFSDYYKKVLAEFQANYKGYDKDTLLQCAVITTVVAANAIDRAKEKDGNAKKFKKMAEKLTFWAKAIALRLEHEYGLNQNQVDQEIDKLLADV